MRTYFSNCQTVLWLAAWLGLAVFWSLRLSPTALPDAPQALGKPLDCVSYSPFRFKDLNPFNYAASVNRAQIEADLKLLQPWTDCVRTYGLTQGLDQVPDVARQLGMRVKLGVWITGEAAHNQRELTKGVKLANDYADVVDTLIVGNEVLLRRELQPDRLATLLRQANAATAVPVSYADVWEFWQRNAALASEVDAVAIHILPYWEDKPVHVRDAAAHVRDTALLMRHQFAGKSMWIGETGWPAVGRQRGPAVPGTYEQARFLRELRSISPQLGMKINVIEAFDQPWKRAFEGAMGAGWGLFTADGAQRVRWLGTVPGDPHAYQSLVAMVGATVLAACLLSMRTALVVGLLAGLGAWQWEMSLAWDRTLLERSMSAALAMLGALTALAFSLQAPKPLRHALNLSVVFAAASAAIVLLIDPRYRPLPWWWFAAPAWAIAVARICSGFSCASQRLTFLAAALALATCGFLIREGWQNVQAWVYAAPLLALAATALPSRTSDAAASSTAGAAN